jgi:alpha-galactosidase
MHRNFFLNDPDAFTVSRQLLEEREIQAPLTLSEAQVSIALSAVSGGMFEIGDDLPTLGKDSDRVALVENHELLQMAKLGRAAVPLDLLSYSSEDEQPSVFLLREDARQSILAVFDWTEHPRSHRLAFSDLGLTAGQTYELSDILEASAHPSVEQDAIHLEQPAHSVKLIKIIDSKVPAGPPSVTVNAPNNAKVDEDVKFSARVDPLGVPALAYRWDFGDGTSESGRQVSHAYTMPGQYSVRLVVEGVDGIPAAKPITIPVSGSLTLPPPRRYQAKE